MNEALDLLSHEMPARDIAALHARAMQALVAELRKQKRAETASPRPPQPPRQRGSNDAPRSRHIPAAVRREVWTRDAARCRYVDDAGRRCAETARLELHHRVPYATRGPHDADNLELRCRAHNDFAAERDFGRVHMTKMKGDPGGARGLPPRWRGSSSRAAADFEVRR